MVTGVTGATCPPRGRPLLPHVPRQEWWQRGGTFWLSQQDGSSVPQPVRTTQVYECLRCVCGVLAVCSWCARGVHAHCDVLLTAVGLGCVCVPASGGASASTVPGWPKGCRWGRDASHLVPLRGSCCPPCCPWPPAAAPGSPLRRPQAVPWHRATPSPSACCHVLRRATPGRRAPRVSEGLRGGRGPGGGGTALAVAAGAEQAGKNFRPNNFSLGCRWCVAPARCLPPRRRSRRRRPAEECPAAALGRDGGVAGTGGSGRMGGGSVGGGPCPRCHRWAGGGG